MNDTKQKLLFVYTYWVPNINRRIYPTLYFYNINIILIYQY